MGQFHPLQRDPDTGELYLPLGEHSNIRLTPYRDSDVPELIQLLNDESICRWVESPPYPYLQGKDA
jgi:hypothetical protein